MPAFTHICAKVSISLFDDTITLYPKKNGNKSTKIFFHPIMGLMAAQMDCEYKEVDDSIEHLDELNEKIRYVRRGDACHDRYHQDNFDHDDSHYHLKFSKTINEQKLIQILILFTKYQLISQAEQASFLSAYRTIQQSDMQLSQLAAKATTTTASSISTLFKGKNKQPPVLAIENLFSFNPKHQAFIRELKNMNRKAQQLEAEAVNNRDYEAARDAARALCDSVYFAYNDYRKDNSQLSGQNFIVACNSAFITAEDTLKHHRGSKEIWANIGLAFATLLLGYLAYGLYNKYANNGDFMFFKINTDSKDRKDKLQSATYAMNDDFQFVV